MNTSLILVKGIEKPIQCASCPFLTIISVREELYDICRAKHSVVYPYSLPDDCPISVLPPHGDLIDRNALLEKITKPTDGMKYVDKVLTADKEELRTAMINIPLIINNAPTVLEADEKHTEGG